MAASGPAAAAALTPSAGPFPRALPYGCTTPGLRRQRTATALTTTATATPVAAAAARIATPSVWTTCLSTAITSRLTAHVTVLRITRPWRSSPPLLQPGPVVRPAAHGFLVRAGYFREGSSQEGSGSGASAPDVPAPDSDTLECTSGADALDARATNGIGTGSVAGGVAQGPQGNAVPFVPSTRQRHHAAAAVAAAAAARVWRSAGNVSEEDEAYAGADEDIRRRARAMRQAMFLEAEQRAVGLHPDILMEDLAAEATVPYDSAGSLDPVRVLGDEGEAAGPPSSGGGPHGGLAVESVDAETGGFTTSWPAADQAYDDVGRAIRQEHDPWVRRRRRHPSLAAAEAQARKAATAEDLREALLDAAPELQSTYRVYGLPRDDLLRNRSHGGTMPASDEQVEALLEALPFGAEGAVMTEEGQTATKAASALADPLGSPSSGAVASGDPLAALDALEHREVLEMLESGATASTDNDLADLANVMPSPLFSASSSNGSSSNSSKRSSNPSMSAASRQAGAAGSSSSGDSGPSTQRRALHLGRAAAGATQRGLSRGHVASRRRQPAATGPGLGAHGGAEARQVLSPPSSSYPPFYHTSPDVPEEDLRPRPRRRRNQRSAVPTTAAAAAAARAATSGGREALPSAGDAEMAQGPEGRRAGGAPDRTRAVLQAPLYKTSPDVQDVDLEVSTGAAIVGPSAVPIEVLRSGDATADAASGSRACASDISKAKGPSVQDQPATPPGTSTAAHPMRHLPPPPPQFRSDGDGRRLRSLSDVDRQFIEFDAVGSWDEQAHVLRTAMSNTIPKQGRAAQQRQTMQPPGARGASSSLQTQTIGIHGSTGGSASAVTAPLAGSGSGSGEGRNVTVLRVNCVPSQTYGVARTAAVLAADGQLTLLARPTGPSPERVRAALKLLHMAPDSRDFRESAEAAAATAADNDERAAAATEAAAVAAAMAAVGTPGMELEAQHRPPSPVPPVNDQDLQPGLILGQSEIDPAEVEADPNFPIESSWTDHHDHHDPHDPHLAPPMAVGEGHVLGLQANMWQEDYDEVMGQISDAQRSGWSEDAVNGVFDSDVY